MAKIKCPHCGAVNQDVTEKDACWQCNAVLGAGAAPAAPSGASSVPSEPAAQDAAVRRPSGPSPLDRFLNEKPRPNRAPLAIAIALLLILLIVVGLALYLRSQHALHSMARAQGPLPYSVVRFIVVPEPGREPSCGIMGVRHESYRL
jgi:hypothetical protein